MSGVSVPIAWGSTMLMVHRGGLPLGRVSLPRVCVCWWGVGGWGLNFRHFIEWQKL